MNGINSHSNGNSLKCRIAPENEKWMSGLLPQKLHHATSQNARSRGANCVLKELFPYFRRSLASRTGPRFKGCTIDITEIYTRVVIGDLRKIDSHTSPGIRAKEPLLLLLSAEPLTWSQDKARRKQ